MKLFILALALAPAISALKTANITIFHVNPDSFGAAPVNMDTADVGGDMYFDMRSKALPIECADDPHSLDCNNPEVTADDLVITKLILEVDTDSYSTNYGRCNICENHTDHHGNNNCTNGQYICACSDGPSGEAYTCYNKKCYRSHHGSQNETECEKTCGKASDFEVAMKTMQPSAPGKCNSSVGYENITLTHGNRTCGNGSPNWSCWHDAVAKKTGGMWYSTTTAGYCGEKAVGTGGCTWKVAEVVKRVNKTCSDNSIYNLVESTDAKGSKCFDKCSGVGPKRNSSEPCWITCFYDTVLGPGASQPGGQVTGMPFSDLATAWNAPFDSEDAKQSGCPKLPWKP